MRWAWPIALLCPLVACNAQAFACAGDGDCMLGGEPGVCVEGNCAYPDDGCASGYRYPAGLGGGLAGQCAPGDGDTDGTGSDAGTSDASAEESSSGSPVTSATSDDPSNSGATQPIDPTRDASSSSVSDPISDSVSEASSISESISVTSDSIGTNGSSGDFESTSGVSMTTEFGSSSGVVLACTDMQCGDCMRCVDAEGEACAMEAAHCGEAVGCPDAAGCMEYCVVTGDCMTNCCEGLEAGTAVDAAQLHECRVEACAMVCDEADPLCV